MNVYVGRTHTLHVSIQWPNSTTLNCRVGKAAGDVGGREARPPLERSSWLGARMMVCRKWTEACPQTMRGARVVTSKHAGSRILVSFCRAGLENEKSEVSRFQISLCVLIYRYVLDIVERTRILLVVTCAYVKIYDVYSETTQLFLGSTQHLMLRSFAIRLLWVNEHR